MKICDRCGERAVDEVILKSEDTHVDVCGGCRQHVLEALRPKEPEAVTAMEVEAARKRRGRPPKNSGKPE